MKVKTTYPDGRVEEFEGTPEEWVKVSPQPLGWFWWNPLWWYSRPMWQVPSTSDRFTPTVTWTYSNDSWSASNAAAGSTVTVSCPDVANS